MAKLVSQTYGEALFEAAIEEGTLDSLMEEVQAVLVIFHENDDYVKLLSHPKIPMEEKLTLLEKAFKGKVSNQLAGLLATVVEKGRFSEVKGILNFFIDKVREYKGIGTAYVTSATPLKDSEKASVEKRLLATTSYKSFRISYQTDKSLIGGMVIRIGDRVVDSSIRTKLANMAKELSKVQLANV